VKNSKTKNPANRRKVETHEQFSAERYGYELFQGYFFCRPEMVSRRSVPENKLIYIQLLRAVTAPQIDLIEIGRLIKQEVSLSYRLLRYLNSPLFACPAKSTLSSTRCACWRARHSKMGFARQRRRYREEQARRIGAHAPGARAILRAVGRSHRSGAGLGDMFLLGLLSLLDAMLNMPLQKILAGLPVDEEIRNALNGRPSRFRSLFEVVLDYEKPATWEQLEQFVPRRWIGRKPSFRNLIPAAWHDCSSCSQVPVS